LCLCGGCFAAERAKPAGEQLDGGRGARPEAGPGDGPGDGAGDAGTTGAADDASASCGECRAGRGKCRHRGKKGHLRVVDDGGGGGDGGDGADGGDGGDGGGGGGGGGTVAAGPVFVRRDDNLPPTTEDPDPLQRSRVAETREHLLGLCYRNHYQFDELRRAKHATQMVLHHLHHPGAAAHVFTCNACGKEIAIGDRWHCARCPNYDLCTACRDQGRAAQASGCQHELARVADQVLPAVTRERSGDAALRGRADALQRFLDALVHAIACARGDAACGHADCAAMKALLRHRGACTVRTAGGCTTCCRALCLVKMHARRCPVGADSGAPCPVPHCADLKRLFAAQRQEAVRRQLSDRRLKVALRERFSAHHQEEQQKKKKRRK
jgi:hypothetical protein